MSKIFVPRRRRADIVKNYVNLTAGPRAIDNGGQTRGLFILRITDSNSATNPDRWEITITGGFSYTGDNAKYFPIFSSADNVTSVTATVVGFEYDLVDAFGRTHHLIFNGQRGFVPTIEQTAGPATVGPVEVRSILFQ